MANEQERPIEKLLREAARQRRDQAREPFALHPATRRLLQGEVSRQYGGSQAQRRSPADRLTRWWPRLAWAGATLAVLGTVVWLVLPSFERSEPSMSLAKNKSMAETAAGWKETPAPPESHMKLGATRMHEDELQKSAAPVAPPLPHAAAPAAPTAAAIEKTPAPTPAEAPARTRRQSASEPAAVAQGGAASERAAERTTSARELDYPQPAPSAASASGAIGAATPAPVQPAPAPPATAPQSELRQMDKLAANRSDQLLSDSGKYRLDRSASAHAATLPEAAAAPITFQEGLMNSQRFTQSANQTQFALADRAKPVFTVLNTFRLEQSGSKLRIIDADGSVYSGSIHATDIQRQQHAAAAQAPAPAQKDQFQSRLGVNGNAQRNAAQSYAFRVTGTNGSLHRKVVFSGELLPALNQTAATVSYTNAVAVQNFGAVQNNSNQSLSGPFSNSRISGKLVIGKAKAVELNADPVNP